MNSKKIEEFSKNNPSTILQKKEFIKQRLDQLKNQEQSLKIKERKFRTRHMIEMGGLVTKASLDHLPHNILFGALLSLQKQLNDPQVLKQWEYAGGQAFKNEQKIKSTTAVVIKFNTTPSDEIKILLKASSCKWNKIRKEWEGLLSQEQRQTISEAMREGDGTITVLEKE